MKKDYFPEYINEVSCNKDSTKCLGLHGKCHQSTLNIRLLKRTGECKKGVEEYEKHDFSFKRACECGLSIHSALTGLQKGQKSTNMHKKHSTKVHKPNNNK